MIIVRLGLGLGWSKRYLIGGWTWLGLAPAGRIIDDP